MYLIMHVIHNVMIIELALISLFCFCRIFNSVPTQYYYNTIIIVYEKSLVVVGCHDNIK